LIREEKEKQEKMEIERLERIKKKEAVLIIEKHYILY